VNCSPSLDQAAGLFPASFGQRGSSAADRSISSIGGFVADRAVRSFLVVVSTPSLAFSPRIVEAHEPMSIQTFRSEAAVECFDEGLSVGLPGLEKSNVTPR
jgi:hypothetical protein